MRVIYGFSAIAAVVWVSLALAQNREPTRPAAGARPAAATAAAAVIAAPTWTADQQIAACLYYGCRNEVEISKFAAERLQSSDLKQFAERMATEHEEACQKLAKVAGPALEGNTRLDVIPGRPARVEGREGARDARREEGAPEAREERREGREEARAARREAEPAAAAPRVTAEPGRGLEIEAGGARVQVQPGARPRTDIEIRGGAAGGLNWISIHKQIADQCLATAKQEFGQKEGAELDRCYLGGQIMGHMKALDEIKVLRNYASPELRAELDACSEHCADHLKEAKVLAKKLEGESAPRVSRKPDAPPAKPE